MKKTLFLVMALFVVSLLGNAIQAYGMEMTAEQKELWRLVEAVWEGCKKGDLDLVAGRFNDESQEWWGMKMSPLEKGTIKLNYQQWLDYDKPVSYLLEPLAIHILGDVANVFYLYKWKGNKISQRGRMMETWRKLNNKWTFMGSMSAYCDTLPACPVKND